MPNLALSLVRELYTEEEMRTSNCRGVKGKKALDIHRLNYTCMSKNKFFFYSPVPTTDFEQFWKKGCVSAINEGCRRLRRVHKNDDTCTIFFINIFNVNKTVQNGLVEDIFRFS